MLMVFNEDIRKGSETCQHVVVYAGTPIMVFVMLETIYESVKVPLVENR